MTISYIAIGANLDNPCKQVQTALNHLSTLPQTYRLSCSSFYQSRPFGPSNQPDYVNVVVAIETELPVQALLKALQRIEEKQGRQRRGERERWGPRVVDLDILLYWDLLLQNEDLTIPHPGLSVREFVLYPLAEIAKDLILPTGESILELRAKCPNRGIKIIKPSPSSTFPDCGI